MIDFKHDASIRRTPDDIDLYRIIAHVIQIVDNIVFEKYLYQMKIICWQTARRLVKFIGIHICLLYIFSISHAWMVSRKAMSASSG